MFHCFDHEIVLEGMKEEISQQRCTIGAHWYTNNLPENRASKTNVDVVDKKVNSETKLSTREVCVPHGHPIIRPEGAKIIGSNEKCKRRLTGLHDSYSSWHLFICRFLFGLSTFFVASLLFRKGSSFCVIRRK